MQKLLFASTAGEVIRDYQFVLSMCHGIRMEGIWKNEKSRSIFFHFARKVLAILPVPDGRGGSSAFVEIAPTETAKISIQDWTQFLFSTNLFLAKHECQVDSRTRALCDVSIDSVRFASNKIQHAESKGAQLVFPQVTAQAPADTRSVVSSANSIQCADGYDPKRRNW